ncbi:VWA domain-containing protein [Gordonia phosphorivorans]|uniref:VWA domain-containing protein n=1 Tax=Gordonia phosphorivorans TaxID=1056982 RepID=A0ABV6H650_9ACTN
MKFSALLDVNVVALETEDRVAVLLDLEAPAAAEDAERPKAALQVVLDRSGSMRGAPLDGAKRALVDLVRRLEPTDDFGLVIFDDAAQVVVPAGPLDDKKSVIDRINSVQAGGMTDLSSGYLRGLRELRRVAGESGGTLLIVSDGHVNTGLREPDEFASLAAKAYADRLVTSTLGYGDGYDETLLSALARAGAGNHVFAADPDAAGAAIAGEVDGLLNKVVQGLALTVSMASEVAFVRLYNDLPAVTTADGAVLIDLGDLYGQERRKLLLEFAVPAMAGLGLARIATLELRFVELPGLVEQVATLPISVNVVPGDAAAGRVPEPSVTSELLFQQAQERKRRASEAFERGEYDSGDRLMGDAHALLGDSLGAAPEALRADIEAEIAQVDAMSRLSKTPGPRGAGRMSKISRASYHRANRKRGRGPDPVS